MTTPNRIPYFKPEKVGFFSSDTKWKKDVCRPLNNPHAHIQMERPPKGWTPPPPPPKAEEPKIDKKAAKQPEQRLPEPPQPTAPAKKKDDEDDDCYTPPPFDMLDLPGAMKKMGFPVAAKLAQRWFDRRKYILSNDPSASYPGDLVDKDDVSLSFVLSYDGVVRKYEKLIREGIYSESALNFMKKKIRQFVGKKFIDSGESFNGVIDTLSVSGGDIQRLHEGFQFQKGPVSSWDTLSSNLGMTDLTASLANFDFMAAVATAKVVSEKYYNYDGPSPLYCSKPSVEVSHIYVYAKDSYSFADDPNKGASQYLGHWNRSGMIMVVPAAASDAVNRVTGSRGTDLQWGDYPDKPVFMPYIYDNGFKKPVDIM